MSRRVCKKAHPSIRHPRIRHPHILHPRNIQPPQHSTPHRSSPVMEDPPPSSAPPSSSLSSPAPPSSAPPSPAELSSTKALQKQDTYPQRFSPRLSPLLHGGAHVDGRSQQLVQSAHEEEQPPSIDARRDKRRRQVRKYKSRIQEEAIQQLNNDQAACDFWKPRRVQEHSPQEGMAFYMRS